MKLSFKGKSAVITGASGGMGLEISKKLSENNISVLMLDLQSPSKDFLLKNKNCQFKKVDVTNFKKLKSHIDNFYKNNKSIDYLINTTGVLWFDKDVSAVNISSGIWDKVFEINLKSMVYLSKIVVPLMKKNSFGSMVHISSIDALSGDDKPQDAYGASKAAMIRLSKSFAIQFASNNIRSNIVLPGPIETGMQLRWKKSPKVKKKLEKFIPLNRVGKPEDISNASIFLISDQANYITGTEMIVDGGITSKP
jgi:NAD(P)-dependent dehydrogenase (short-subunit alcohol dehydrogenase family)